MNPPSNDVELLNQRLIERTQDMLDKIVEIEQRERRIKKQNAAMTKAITSAVGLMEGLDKQLKGNHAMFLLAALDKLQPFNSPH